MHICRTQKLNYSSKSKMHKSLSAQKNKTLKGLSGGSMVLDMKANTPAKTQGLFGPKLLKCS